MKWSGEFQSDFQKIEESMEASKESLLKVNQKRNHARRARGHSAIVNVVLEHLVWSSGQKFGLVPCSLARAITGDGWVP